jgi:formylglycine-generating enzyme required for sulfatase activity
MFPTTIDQWNANLRCGNAATWGPTTDANDDRPINCVTWYEAYAFCIWDKGFLPSEAEWNYAAADGAEQRLYPWGSADPTIDYAIYGCLYPQATSCQDESSGNIANFGPDLGRSPFGMWNLAGNVSEWVLDVYGDYPVPCADCAALSGAAAQRVFRGGSFDRGPTDMFTSARVGADPSSRLPDVGFRCARAP